MMQIEDRMAARATEESVLSALTSKPQMFSAVLAQVCGGIPNGWDYYPTKATNKVNRVLQTLKRKGRACYLSKGAGGPGWVLAGGAP